MPQLDPTWYPSQLFWLCICFFTMLFVMGKIFTPQIADILEKRQRKIDDYLVKANQLQEQAEESLHKYQKALTQATQDANTAIELAHKELDEYINKKQEDLNKKLNEKIQQGEEKISEEKEKALKEVKNVSEELALKITQKIGLTEIKATDIKEAMKKVAND